MSPPRTPPILDWPILDLPTLSPPMHPHFEALFQLYQADHPSLSEATLARVTRQDRGRVVVDHLRSLAYRPHLSPVVGDYVVVDQEHVVEILERKQLLERRAPGSVTERQAIAANIDLVVIVQPAEPLNLARIERGVSLAYQSGASALVALTKSDLDDASAEVEARVIGVRVVSLAATVDTRGLDDLREELAGKTAVLLGPSGAGKSTLLNSLVGDERAATGEVRAADQKGRHTTTRRELYALPSGGELIDTPGTRELGLIDAGDEALGFDDIDALAAHCRFRDCQHEGESGCAVQENIDSERLASYRRQKKELRWMNESNHEARARSKKFAGVVKTAKRIKGKP